MSASSLTTAAPTHPHPHSAQGPGQRVPHDASRGGGGGGAARALEGHGGRGRPARAGPAPAVPARHQRLHLLLRVQGKCAGLCIVLIAGVWPLACAVPVGWDGSGRADPPRRFGGFGRGTRGTNATMHLTPSTNPDALRQELPMHTVCRPRPSAASPALPAFACLRIDPSGGGDVDADASAPGHH